MLLRIPEIVQTLQPATSQQIARCLQIDEMTLQPMLTLLIKKGLLLDETAMSCQKSCGSCQWRKGRYRLPKSEGFSQS